jgi:hypothetical protein
MPGRIAPLTVPLVLAALSAFAGEARAHRLVAAYQVLPGHKVQVSGRYKVIPRSIPAENARVRVFRADNQLLAEGRTDTDGRFTFSYEKPEPLRVEVYQEGHRDEVQIETSELKTTAAAEAAGPLANAARSGKAAESMPRPAGPASKAGNSQAAAEDGRQWIKDVLVGIGFLLAFAAFVLSLRNSRRLRALQRTFAQTPGRTH